MNTIVLEYDNIGHIDVLKINDIEYNLNKKVNIFYGKSRKSKILEDISEKLKARADLPTVFIKTFDFKLSFILLEDSRLKSSLDLILSSLLMKYKIYKTYLDGEKNKILEKYENVDEYIQNLIEEIYEYNNKFIKLANTLLLNINSIKIDVDNKEELSFIRNNTEKLSIFDLDSEEKQILILLIHVLTHSYELQYVLTHSYELHSIVLIDLPETGLHIDTQYELINNLLYLNEDAQYIITSNSPEIMAEIEDSCIFKI